MGYDINKSKEIVDKIFESLDGKPIQLKKLDMSSKSAVETAKELALEEMENIRKAFIEFQEKISGYMMYNYMTGTIEQIAIYASDMTGMIEDDIDESKLSPDALAKYRSIKKLRAQILSSIYNKYKGGQSDVPQA